MLDIADDLGSMSEAPIGASRKSGPCANQRLGRVLAATVWGASGRGCKCICGSFRYYVAPATGILHPGHPKFCKLTGAILVGAAGCPFG